MNDPKRLLLDPSATEFEKELLESWKSERPTARGRERTLAMLGLAGATTAAAPIAGTVGGAIAPKVATLGWVATAKWAMLGGVAAIGFVAATYPLLHATDPAPPSVHVAELPAQSAVFVAPRAPSLPAIVDTAPTASTAPIPHAARENPSSLPIAQAQARAAPSASLADQVAELDRARAALDRGEAARTGQLVDAYEARNPDGAFVQEAEVLRIEALELAGDRAGASLAAAHFFAAYPKSPHAGRVHALISAP